MHSITYIALMITLIYAAWRDHTCRRIPHRTWIPLILISIVPLIHIWQKLGWEVGGITALLCAGIYFMPILFAGNAGFTIHGADAVAAIFITLIKPLTLDIQHLFFSYLLQEASYSSQEPYHPSKKVGKNEGFRVSYPITAAAACIIGLP